MISHSEQDTFEYGFSVGTTLTGGEVIALAGDLGAGKTVFTKGLAAALGIRRAITSPTFTVLNLYASPSGLTLCHCDAYRLKSGDEAYGVGLTDYIGASDCVCVIEWAQNVSSVLPKNLRTITILRTGDTQREILDDYGKQEA